MILASKVILYDVSDNKSQGLGMSCISVAWGAGIVLGPLVSGELSTSHLLCLPFRPVLHLEVFLMPGFLAEPATQFPSVFSEDGIFGRLPYLLPALVAAAMCLPPIVLSAWQLPETKNLLVALTVKI